MITHRSATAGGRNLPVAWGSLVVLALACGEPASPRDSNSPSGGSGGSAGSAAIGGTATAGSGAGGSAGAAMGGSGPAGGAGAGAAPSGGAAGAAGIGASGDAGMGGALGGSSGSAGASAGAGGEPMGGAAGGAGMPGGAGGGGGMAGDGCDIAVHDPADPPAMLTLSGSLGTHDPVIIEADNRFYLFSTGNNVGAKTSTDLLSWQNASEVWSGQTRPSWLSQQVPGVSNLWAPDISFFGGQYHLYYSASTFGDNRSCIAHATRASLASGSWSDQGPVICSNVNSNDNWNAIDPNVVLDEAGTAWLSFGSFWSGIKMIELDSAGARVGTTLHALANRPSNGGALEAPFIVRRCGYYYLFVSFDTCCQGVNSTYNIRVGRSTSVTGPYADKAGTAMPQGGGTLLVQADSRWRGPGHNAILFRGDSAYNIYHAYDSQMNGASRLRIAELVWDAEGWPISAGP